MANKLLTISMITREALRLLENELTFTKGVNREYDDRFAISGAKIGNALNIRKPARFTVSDGAVLQIQDYTETYVQLVLDKRKHIGVQFTSEDLTLSLDDFSRRILKPQVTSLANQIDMDGLALYQDIYNAVGVPGTTPNALLTYLQAGAVLDNEAAPRDGMRSIVMNPDAQAIIVDGLKGLFENGNKIADQYDTGTMGKAVGFKWNMDQNVATHTVGPLGGTPLVNGVSQTGSTLNTDGWTAAAALRLLKGDVFTIAGVFAVNPQNRQSTGRLRQFVVTADTSSDGAGLAAIPIYPAIITSGAYQTVSAGPADNAAITVLGAANTITPANMAYHKDAFTMACVDLETPRGTDMAYRVSDPQIGISLRMIKDYQIVNDVFPCRLDVLYGWKTLYPELAVRVQG